jgi:Na+-transporting NADH:ubiquinone oxidoreductase subunit NqrB
LFYQLQSPFFGPGEGGVDGSFAQIQFSSMHQIFGQDPKNHFEAAILLPLLKTAMAGLIGRVAVGQVMPRRSGAQDPQDSIQNGSCLPRRPPLPIRTPWFHEHTLEYLPLAFGQIHSSLGAKSLRAVLLFAPFLFSDQSLSFKIIYEIGSNICGVAGAALPW